MVLQWATKRLCKFFLKRLNKFLNEEIDVEQLDLQLGSGTGQIKDLGLNTDYINDQVKSLPFVLKSGSIDRILVRLPSDIELDGLHLHVAPRGSFEKVAESKQSANAGDRSSAGGTPPPEYVGVSDGVRIIGQMVKSLLLCLRVKVTGIVIEVENQVTVHIRSLEYGYEDVKQESTGDGSTNVVKVVKVVEAGLDVGGNPVLGQNGISASVRVSVPFTEGVAVPKISLHASVEPVIFQASFNLVEQLFSVASLYSGCSGNAGTESIYHDASSFYDSRSTILESKVDIHGKYTLPVIADWMRKPELSEPELEASVDEFFECIDAWNQSASSSDIWNWTRSAFGAASISGNLPAEAAPMQFSVTSRVKGVSAKLLYDRGGEEGLKLTFEEVALNGQVSEEESSLEAQIRCIEISQLGPSSSQEACYRRLSGTGLPRFPVGLKSSSGSVKLLKVAPLKDQPAAKMILRRQSPKNGNRRKVSISLQPLAVWIDDSAVDQLLRSLTRLQKSLHSAESVKDEQYSKTDFKLDVSVPALRTFLTTKQSSSGCILALDLGSVSASFRDNHQQKTDGRSLLFTAAEGILYSIRGTSSSQLVRISGKASVEMRWTENTKTGAWVPKKIWDGVAAQRMSYESSGGSNSEFASATTLGLEFDASTFDLLKATSSLYVQVSVSRLVLDFSKTEHFEVLRLLAHPGAAQESKQVSTTQVLFTFSVREVEIEMLPLKKDERLHIKAEKLRIAYGAGLGRDPSASYFQINHGDGELLGQETGFITVKPSDIGRGDGGSRNALSTGTAGLTFTVVTWPGKEQLADVIFAGCTKGMTLLTQGGRFDWLTAVISFSDKCCEPFQQPKDEQVAEESRRSYFLFNFQDAALRYEPVSGDSEAQTLSSVGCLLAVAALRISSGEPAEHNIISLRDLGLHIVDTRLSKSGKRSLREEGYVQVAKSPVVGAKLKINRTQLPNWELEFTDNQLNFDTCSDTTAAFGNLVSDLQQIFASDVQKSAEMQLRTMRGKSTAGDEAEAGDYGDADGLFSGLVEDAFACPKVPQSRSVHAASCSTADDPTVLVEPTVRQVDEPDSPVFIEDYLRDHVSNVSLSSSQESLPSRQPVNDSEPRCAWFSSVDLIDTHVPLEKGSSPEKGSSAYPPAVGRVGFTGWKIRWRLYGGSDWENKRSSTKCVEVSVQGMNFQYETFGPTGLYASSLIVNIRDVHVYDCSVDAPWRLILGYYYKKSCPREYTSKAVEFQMDAVRPNPSTPLEEYRLLIAVLPICVHLDQDHVDFFRTFFSSFKEADQNVSSVSDDTILPFFQVCEIRSSSVRVDYIPRSLNYAELKAGNLYELVNLWSWKGVELELKELHTSGVYGWTSLLNRLLDKWLGYLAPQLPRLLLTAAPLRPVYSVSSGAAQLIILPAEQYKKDRRFLRGMRKGAVAFFHTISLEALGLGANLAAGARQILVHTEKALGGGSLPGDKKEQRRKNQPSGPREGLQQAYESIAQGLNRTAVSLVSNPVKVYQRGGGAGVAVASAIRASPAAILAPASAAADAVHHALLGIRNGLDPERKRAYDEKHTGPAGDVKRWR